MHIAPTVTKDMDRSGNQYLLLPQGRPYCSLQHALIAGRLRNLLNETYRITNRIANHGMPTTSIKSNFTLHPPHCLNTTITSTAKAPREAL